MSTEAGKILSIDELKLLVAPAAKEYGVAKVYLFGSVARGDCDENSDYDFCIECGKIKSLLKLGGLYMDIKDAVGRDISLVTTGMSNRAFLEKIMREAILLYEE
jgi:predicted nucleotidyltransferase